MELKRRAERWAKTVATVWAPRLTELRRRATKWAATATRWAETVAIVWAAHWLLITGSCLIFGSDLLKWVYFPFSRHPYGLQLPLLQNAGVIPHLSLFSYGVVGSAVLMIGLVLASRSDRFLAMTAAILLALWVMLPCQIAFQQPALLGRLTAEDQDLPSIRGFAKTYLPANYATTEPYSAHFDFDTLRGRFTAAWYFLALGWYCFGAGSVCIAIYSIGRLPARRRLTALTVGGVPVAVLLIFLTPSLVGTYHFNIARVAQANGNRDKAIAQYRKAIWWDRVRAEDISIYATIGDLERLSDSGADSSEKHISKAEELKGLHEYDSALFELGRAAAGGGKPAIAARRESARIHVSFGNALYQDGGIGAAVVQWEQAIVDSFFPQEQVSFLIARGNFDLGRYQAALDAVQRVLRTSGDTPIRANAYSVGADCYMKLGQVIDARKYYNLSLAEELKVTNVNFWAMRGVTGD